MFSALDIEKVMFMLKTGSMPTVKKVTSEDTRQKD